MVSPNDLEAALISFHPTFIFFNIFLLYLFYLPFNPLEVEAFPLRSHSVACCGRKLLCTFKAFSMRETFKDCPSP